MNLVAALTRVWSSSWSTKKQPKDRLRGCSQFPRRIYLFIVDKGLISLAHELPSDHCQIVISFGSLTFSENLRKFHFPLMSQVLFVHQGMDVRYARTSGIF